jgi:hypothetical protein
MKTPTPIQPHTFNFSRYSEEHPLVSMTISKGAELSEAIDAFETFLIAVGYMLPDGAHLGYEYEDEADAHFHHESYCRKCDEKNS